MNLEYLTKYVFNKTGAQVLVSIRDGLGFSTPYSFQAPHRADDAAFYVASVSLPFSLREWLFLFEGDYAIGTTALQT